MCFLEVPDTCFFINSTDFVFSIYMVIYARSEQRRIQMNYDLIKPGLKSMLSCICIRKTSLGGSLQINNTILVESSMKDLL